MQIINPAYDLSYIITTGQKVVKNQRLERRPELISGAPGRDTPFQEGAGMG
jgi:hypothetical protein